MKSSMGQFDSDYSLTVEQQSEGKWAEHKGLIPAGKVYDSEGNLNLIILRNSFDEIIGVKTKGENENKGGKKKKK